MIPAARRPTGKWVRFLVVMTVVATAFNDLEAFLPAGELANDAFIYVFPLLFLALLRRPGEIAAPILLTLMVLMLAIALSASVAVNWNEISSAQFKGRGGFDRAVTQGMAVAFGLVIVLVFYNLTLRGCLPQIARGARWAILVMAAVGMLELASWFSVPGLADAHRAIAAVIHSGSGIDYVERLRATAFEVSWAAVMMTFLFPFAICDLPARGGRFWFYVALVFVLIALAQSRTGMLAIGLQGLLMLGLYMLRRIDQLARVGMAACVLAIVVLVTPGLGDRVTEPVTNLIQYGSFNAQDRAGTGENVSNVTRLAAIRAGVSMFRDNPLVGVGLGQYGFSYAGHILAEDYRSWEVRLYAAEGEELWPPAYSLHVRLLAETGILGYGLWLAIVLPVLLGTILRAGFAGPPQRIRLAVAMTLLGWLLLGISIDSFRFFGGWIALGVAFALQTRDVQVDDPEPD